MGETTTHIDATPEQVFAHLTKAIDDIEPGPLRVGNQFRLNGQDPVFTVTVVEPPSRFGFSVLTGDVTSAVEYTILPDGAGSLVRAEMDQRGSPMSFLGVALYSALSEGRNERKLVDELKKTVEAEIAALPAKF